MAESPPKQPDENDVHTARPSFSEWEQRLAEAAEIDRHRTGPPYAMDEIWSTKGMLPEGFVPTSIYDYPLSVWWQTEEGKAAADRLQQETEQKILDDRRLIEDFPPDLLGSPEPTSAHFEDPLYDDFVFDDKDFVFDEPAEPSTDQPKQDP